MKSKGRHICIFMWLLASFLLMVSSYSSVADAIAVKPNTGYDFKIISSGETKFIDVVTGGLLSLGDVHILNVVALGSGELGIGMEKSDTGGELIMMTGVAISLNGTVTPIFKMGFTPNALSESVEIGDESTPNGFLFLVTGVLFSLGKVSEGEYSIELGF